MKYRKKIRFFVNSKKSVFILFIYLLNIFSWKLCQIIKILCKTIFNKYFRIYSGHEFIFHNFLRTLFKNGTKIMKILKLKF